MPYNPLNPKPEDKTARRVVCLTPDEKARVDTMLERESLAFSPLCYDWIMGKVEAWEKKNGIAPA